MVASAYDSGCMGGFYAAYGADLLCIQPGGTRLSGRHAGNHNLPSTPGQPSQRPPAQYLGVIGVSHQA
ncbi:hypothetical protein GCM10023091_31500 [Ravibacter arvi]|uniref:Uncharacterized protein n=1 Tax=Ravibacter arvi TaxID=2051041 RepID=A0ABP8M4F8_9BACT